jgi:hypothetical protein
MAMKKMSELKTIFKGVSSFRYSKTIVDDLSTAEWDFELPIANDSLNISQAAGTLNPTKVFGSASAWTITGEPGEITAEMFIPTIDEDLMEVFYTKSASVISTASETISDVAGTYEGYAYKLSNKMIEGSMMIVSENKEYALFIKNAQGYPSLVFDSPLDTPMGVNLSLQVADGGDTTDIALLKWKPTV